MSTVFEIEREPLPFELVIAYYHDGTQETIPYHRLSRRWHWEESTSLQSLPRREFIAGPERVEGIDLCRKRGHHDYGDIPQPNAEVWRYGPVLVWCLECEHQVDVA